VSNSAKDVGQQPGVKAICMWREWEDVQCARTLGLGRQLNAFSWRKLDSGWFKCKVDANLYNNLSKTCVG
jgi:hypothetical protein